MRVAVAVVIACTVVVGAAARLDAQAAAAFPEAALGFRFGQSPAEAASICTGAGHRWTAVDTGATASPTWICDQPPSSIGHTGHVSASFCRGTSLCQLEFESARLGDTARRAAFADLDDALRSHYGDGSPYALEGIYDIGRVWQFRDEGEVILAGVAEQRAHGFVRIIYFTPEAARRSHEPPPRDPRPL